MPPLPGQHAIEQFPLKLRGSFGRFKTSSSHELQFITTTLTINQLTDLKTASEVFDARDVNFDELMQRDIDNARVAEIANNYLASPREKAIFFPPLLVCVAVLDEHRRIRPTYSVETEALDQNDSIRTVYGGSAFRIDLYTARSSESTREVVLNGQPKAFFEWATELAINPDRATLMVLDGQHRLQALKLLASNPETRDIVAGIEQPVCIIWLVPQPGDNGKVASDLRELFVTVNTEPRRVSGHFILLLRDSSYSAATIRLLADAWKTSGEWSRLHLLEWNTREDESTSRRQREFSITTISIIDEAIREGLFETAGVAWLLTRLQDCESELEAIDPQFNYRGLRDARQSGAVDEVVIRQIRTELVPALDVLLRCYRPYAEQERRLERAFNELRDEARAGNPSAVNLGRYLSRFVYRSADMHDELARGAWSAFRVKAKADERDSTFFLAVYQRGYLRVWISIARLLAESGVHAVDAARAFVAGMEKLVALPDGRYLDPDQPYINRVLWKGGKVNYTPDWARRAWLDVQQATLARADVRAALLQAIPEDVYPALDRAIISGKLEVLGLQAAHRYAQRLHDELVREVRNNLTTYFGGEVAAGAMRELRITDPADFDAKIAETARSLFEEAVAPFADELGITRSAVEPTD